MDAIPHRYDYDEVGGKMKRVRKNEVYVWARMNTKTGEVDLSEIEQFDDQLPALCEGWEWTRFVMTPTK